MYATWLAFTSTVLALARLAIMRSGEKVNRIQMSAVAIGRSLNPHLFALPRADYLSHYRYSQFRSYDRQDPPKRPSIYPKHQYKIFVRYPLHQ